MIRYLLKGLLHGKKSSIGMVRRAVLTVTALVVLLFISQHVYYKQVVIQQHDLPTPSIVLRTTPVFEATSQAAKDSNTYQEKKKILLLTYERSGSSLTADIIAAHHSVFFTFEPLMPTCIEHTGKDILITDNGIKKPRVKRNMTSYTIEAADVIRSFLNCSISHLPIYVLKNPLFKFRQSTADLYFCVVHNQGKSRRKIKQCILKFEKKCNEKKISLVKTIRYPTWTIESEMVADPQLYLLYLVRDPRGMIHSQISKLRNFNWINVGRVSAEICEFIDKDIEIIKRIQKLYPHRVKIIRYETIAFKPISSARDIYKFVGLHNLSESVKGFIRNHTSANFKDDCAVGCTVRGNSKTVPYKWRLNSSFNRMKIIDKSCSIVYEKLCYKPVVSLKNLRNVSYSLMKSCELNG